jgi:hypothetical protein
MNCERELKDAGQSQGTQAIIKLTYSNSRAFRNGDSEKSRIVHRYMRVESYLSQPRMPVSYLSCLAPLTCFENQVTKCLEQAGPINAILRQLDFLAI